MFGRAGVFSCACWLAEPHLARYLAGVRPGREPARFYFVSGAFETKDGEPAGEQGRLAGRVRPRRVRPAGLAGAGLVLLGLVLPAGGCRPGDRVLRGADGAAAQRAALATLFLEREHARQLVLWRGARRDAPTLGLLAGAGDADDSLALDGPEPARLGLPVPVRVVEEAELEGVFRGHPDGWDAFYTRYPGSAGVVEVTRVHADRRGGGWVVVGRACGEHCRSAWRVAVRREGARWRAVAVVPLRLPRQ